MVQKAVITGFQSPRYFHAVSADKAYVTDWVSNTVAVVNLKTNTITSTIRSVRPRKYGSNWQQRFCYKFGRIWN